MMNGYRRAAMTLRTLGAADRAWLLSQLRPEERERVALLIEEIDALHPDAEAQTFSDVVQADLLESAPVAAPSLPSSPAAVVTRAQPDQIARILADEPDWLVVQVCAIARWPWLPDFLAKLERVRAARIEALIGDVSPARHSLENALVAALAARLEGDVHRNGFDALLSAEQHRKWSTRGFKQRLAQWLR